MPQTEEILRMRPDLRDTIIGMARRQQLKTEVRLVLRMWFHSSGVILEQTDVGNPCIVDEDIQGTEALPDRVKQAGTALKIARIAHPGKAGNAQRFDFALGLF